MNQQFDKILLEPNITSFDSNTQRIRRNLVVVSVIAYFLSVGSDGINEKSSFLGVSFVDLKVESIQIFIAFALVYLLIHFVAASWDHLYENKLRLTGVVIPITRSGTYDSSGNYEPNTDDKRQSSIFSWWSRHRNNISAYESQLLSIDENIKNNQYLQAINSIKQQGEYFRTQSDYIEEALRRFENGFWKYQKRQLIRYITLDFGIPTLIAIAALVLMSIDLFKCHISHIG